MRTICSRLPIGGGLLVAPDRPACRNASRSGRASERWLVPAPHYPADLERSIARTVVVRK
jgi:hypothetical protein